MAAAIGEAAGIHKAVRNDHETGPLRFGAGRPRGCRLLSRRLALEEGVRAGACPPLVTSCRFGGAFASCRVCLFAVVVMLVLMKRAARASGRA